MEENEVHYLLHPDDDLVECITEEGAQRYVDNVLRFSTVVDKVKLICAFFRIRRKEFRYRPSKKTKSMMGGSTTSSFENVDPRFYAVLAAADSHHDFDFDVSNMLPVTLPTNLGGATSFPDRDSDVINMLSAPEHLEFPNSPRILNPLHGADRIQTTFFDVEKLHVENGRALTLDQLTEINRQKTSRVIGGGAKLVAIDVVSHFLPALGVDPLPGNTREGRERSAITKLANLADLLGLLRAKLGPDASFVTDASGDNLVRLMLGLKNVSTAFLRRFLVLDGDFSLVSDVPEKLMRVVRENAVQSERTLEKFDIKITDANRFDANASRREATKAGQRPAATKGNLPIDPRPTGKIFHPDYGVQIELEGIPTASGRYVSATLTDVDGKKREWTFKSESEVQRTVSKNSVNGFVVKKLEGTSSTSKTSKTSTTSFLDDDLSLKAALSLKRAGDWGQVEHCRKFGKAFVTADKMAALYAW